ncbi:MAG: hypothetical protein DRR19_06810 [Candidatus Parabeggiatoa sp. nov. 1]|nr:MAG: hypothetical protein DRR19_06810 [Gammaproteobacteria bacterium]
MPTLKIKWWAKKRLGWLHLLKLNGGQKKDLGGYIYYCFKSFLIYNPCSSLILRILSHRGIAFVIIVDDIPDSQNVATQVFFAHLKKWLAKKRLGWLHLLKLNGGQKKDLGGYIYYCFKSFLIYNPCSYC